MSEELKNELAEIDNVEVETLGDHELEQISGGANGTSCCSAIYCSSVEN